MRIFRAFGRRDLQTLLLILDTAEAEGITDTRFLKTRIANFIDDDYRKRNQLHVKTRVARRKAPTKCPQCGKGVMRLALDEKGMVLEVDGMKIIGCRSCRYSEVIK